MEEATWSMRQECGEEVGIESAAPKCFLPDLKLHWMLRIVGWWSKPI